MKYVEIDGRRFAWRDLVALRKAQEEPKASQPTLFELREDARPSTQRKAADRFLEPTLFDAAPPN